MTIKAKNQVTILGSGTSTGIPLPGCHCKVCSSTDPRDQRLRTSIFLQTTEKTKVLIDCSPDLRMQLLQNGIEAVDHVVITHDHADHVHGIDDLRPLAYFKKTPIPVHTNQVTADSLKDRFPYIFRAHELFNPDTRPIIGGGVPKLDLKVFDPQQGPYNLGADSFTFFELPHGYVQTLCFTHEKLGYIVDCKALSAEVIDHFRQKKLDLLIIDCLQWEKKNHLTHLTFDEALSYIEKINPASAGLIHLSHHLGHQEVVDELVKRGLHHVFPLYDGQVLSYG